jgi:hypothetical protein
MKRLADYALDWYEMIVHPRRWIKKGRPRKKRTGTAEDLIFRL